MSEQNAEICYRPARAMDIAQVAALHDLCFRGTYIKQPYDAAYFEEFLTYEPGPFVVAAAGEKIVGFICANFSTSSKGSQAYISPVDVDPAFRQRGIAGQLVKALEQEILRFDRRRGWNHANVHIDAYIHVANAASRRLFESFGYAVTGVDKDHYGAGEDGVKVAKKLPVPSPGAT